MWIAACLPARAQPCSSAVENKLIVTASNADSTGLIDESSESDNRDIEKAQRRAGSLNWVQAHAAAHRSPLPWLVPPVAQATHTNAMAVAVVSAGATVLKASRACGAIAPANAMLSHPTALVCAGATVLKAFRADPASPLSITCWSCPAALAGRQKLRGNERSLQHLADDLRVHKLYVQASDSYQRCAVPCFHTRSQSTLPVTQSWMPAVPVVQLAQANAMLLHTWRLWVCVIINVMTFGVYNSLILHSSGLCRCYGLESLPCGPEQVHCRLPAGAVQGGGGPAPAGRREAAWQRAQLAAPR